MNDQAAEHSCVIPGCRNESAPPAHGVEDCICDQHLALAKPHFCERLGDTSRRLTKIEALWADDEAYERIVASDRYLKLSHALCCAQEAVEASWTRMKLSIMAAQGSESAPAQDGTGPLRATG